MRSKIRIIAGAVIIIVGLVICGIPFLLSNCAQQEFDDIITSYESDISDKTDEELSDDIKAANQYNRQLASGVVGDDGTNYYDLLSYGTEGMIGYISIPKISVNLPIYHGTTDEVLAKGIGHMENTSLPIGGKSTHSVLVGHTGLSYEIFDNLKNLNDGDVFYVTVQDTTRSYRVISKQKVSATDTESVNIIRDKELVSLVTCVQGLGNERLVVTGEAFTEETTEEITSPTAVTSSVQPNSSSTQDLQSQNNILSGISIAVIILVSGVLILLVIIKNKKSRKEKKVDENNNTD